MSRILGAMVPGPAFLAFVLLAPLLTSCTSPVIEATGAYWMPAIDLEATVVESNIGETIDFNDDLDLDEENIFMGRLVGHLNDRFWVQLEYLPIDYAGDNFVDRIEFAGRVFSGRVITDLEIEYIDVGAGWEFLDVGEGFFRAGTLVEVTRLDVDMVLRSPAGGVFLKEREESEKLNMTFPTVGVVTHLQPLDELDIYGQISGITLSGTGHFYDAEVGLRYMPLQNAALTGGYRIMAFDLESGDDDAKMTLSGPFVGVVLRF